MEDYRNELPGIRRFNNPELYQKTVELQKLFEQNGIAWHNPFSNECNSDFACCNGDGNYDTYFPSYQIALKQHLDELFEHCNHSYSIYHKWLRDRFDSYLKTIT